jgi:uncharacterized pyridoxal phosphate-containing UPF0001 family protein
MADDKKYTERELILAKREAFERGAKWRFVRAIDESKAYSALADEEYETVTAQRYPLPKVTRPRVEPLPGGKYRVLNGVLQVNIGDDWRRAGWTVEEISKLYKLIADPVEEVEDDAHV